MKPMRYISLIIALLSVLGLAAQQQQSQYALYNYRNDGDFNAWLNIDVDSITYSNIGLDSVEYDNIVTQEVWTPDSCYRIPIEVIDSIGFRAPKPEYRPNVYHIRRWHLPYIVKKEGLVLYLSCSIPNDSLPSVGQVIISDVFEEPIQYGFSGRVLSIQAEVDDDNYVITCEAVTLEDVFSRLLLVGRTYTVCDDAPDLPTRWKVAGDGAGGGGGTSWNDDDWDGTFPITLGKIKKNIPNVLGWVSNKMETDDNTLGSMTIEPKFEISYILDVHPFRHSYVKLLFENRTKTVTEYHLKVDGKVDNIGDIPTTTTFYLSDVKMPVVAGLLYADVALKGKLDIKGELDLKASLTKTIYNGDEYEWDSSDFWDIKHTRYDTDPRWKETDNISFEDGDFYKNESEVSFSFKGSFGFGLSFNLGLYVLSEDFVKINNAISAGPELSGSITFSSNGLKDGTWYSTLKDTKITLTPLKLADEVEFTIVGRDFKLGKWEHGFGEEEYRLFPDFEGPTLSTPEQYRRYGYNPFGLYTKVSKDIIPLLPLKIGIGRYDNTGKKLDDSFCPYFYQYEKNWDNSWVHYDLSQLPPNSTFTYHPLLRIWGFEALEVKGMPETEFTVPEPMTLDINTPLNTVTLSKGQDGFYAINGGWGEYSAHSSMRAICNAEIVMNNDKPYVKISASKLLTGPATVTVKDLRDGTTKTIHVIVSNSSVPELTVSEQAVALQESESITVLVTSGSGNYTAESSDESVATATIEGNEIIITAISIGPASVTITDTETKQEVTIEVSVSEAGGNDNTHGEAGQAEYDAAMAAITNGSYYISTKVGGAKYYLTTEGRLTNIKEDGGLFAISKTSGGELYNVGINIDPGTGYHFTNTTLVDEKANLHPGTGAFYMTNNFNRNNWERQVLFLNETGKFAIRSSNTAYGTESWEDAGRTFWTYEVNEAGAPVFDNYGLMACYSYEPTYIWEINKSENLDILPSTILSPEIQWSADIMVFNDSERYGTSADGQVIDTPPSDASGNEWYAPNYKLTNGQKSWNVGYSPFLSETTTTEINAVNWTTWSNSTCWSADKDVADIYMRRTFTVDHALSDRILLSCCHDDAAEWYLNGVLIHSETGYNWNYNYNNSIYLTPEQRALIHTDGRKNVLSVHVHNYGGPALADEGLYEVRE